MTKVPYNPSNGTMAKTNDASTFSDLATAMKAYAMGGWDGIGYRVSEGIGAIDIDHCIDDDDHIREDAQELVDRFDSYCEKSPSGTGLHIIITADGLKDGRRGIWTDDVEVYAQDRYFTVTGNAILDAPIQNGQAVLDELVSRIAPAVKQEKFQSTHP